MKQVVATLWFVSVLAAFASPARAEPVIELLTMGPGDSLWERFGHTAVRARSGDRDLAFSFGNAPFREPSFVWSYLRGHGEFRIIAQSYVRTLELYRGYDREMESQTLRLPPGRATWLMNTMLRRARPPDNRYLYDQLFENCSTKVRDLLDEASLGALKRAAEKREPKRSFRDYTLEAAAGHPVGHWGLDLVGGPHQDSPVDGWAEMYLPLALRDRVAEASVEIGGQRVPLATAARRILERHAPPARSPRLQNARITLLVAGALGLLTVALFNWRKSAFSRRLSGALLIALATLFGIFGVLVWLLVGVSQVHDFRWNENILLFWPSDFVLAAFGLALLKRRRHGRRWLDNYLRWHAAALVVSLLLKLTGAFSQVNAAWLCFAGLSLGAFFLGSRAAAHSDV